jgi:hypothetical protein
MNIAPNYLMNFRRNDAIKYFKHVNNDRYDHKYNDIGHETSNSYVIINLKLIPTKNTGMFDGK